ncbi:MAG: CotH kinase family protein [Flavobacteriales bacterium]|nr:CotH kinase family protein [Flavobacteriales bacterium]
MLQKRTLLLIGIWLPALVVRSQELPLEMYYSANGHQLHTGGQPSAGFYQKEVIRTLDLSFTQPNYWVLLKQNYSSGTDLPGTLVCEGITYDSVGVRFKGETSYFMLAPNEEKRSFNITLDHVVEDQNIMGYETLNLNNAFQDASFLREVVYLELIRDHVPAAKANFVHLNINGESWGIYPNVQQLNSEFLKEWYFSNNGSLWRADRPDGASGPGGSWGDGTAALNYLGDDTATYQNYYTLKRSEQQYPWDELVLTCQKLDQLPMEQLEDSLNHYMDVDRTLWFLASEIAFSDDDSYVHKGKMDYYLYWDEETGRMTPLEYDGNSAMKASASDWNPFFNEDNANYPLMNRLFAVPHLRQRYLAHLRTIIAEKMQSPAFDALIDAYAALIDAEVQADPKKLYSYTAFTTQLNTLKTFIADRRNFLMANSEVAQAGPAISGVAHRVNEVEWAQPMANEPVDVRATVSSANGISAVTLYYCPGLYGAFQRVAMADDGIHNDGAAGDGMYGASIPPQAAMAQVRYYVEAAAADAALSVAYAPPGAEHDVYTYQVEYVQVVDPPVVVNELMAQNTATATDDAGDYEDWIELHNPSNSAVDLGGSWLSDDAADPQKWQFPAGTTIAAGGYLVIWADDEPEQGDPHAAFKLSSSGEEVVLSGSDGQLWDHVPFGPQQADMGYARIPNGTGPFVIQAPTFAANNELATETAGPAPVPELTFFPNPVNGRLTLQGHGALPGEVTIMDATGRPVWAANVAGTVQVDTGSWPAGAYFVRHGRGVAKLIVMQ